MSRPKFAILYIILSNIKNLFIVFNRQKIKPGLIIAIILTIIAIFFSFLAFTPILSPFVYPLF